MRSRAALRSKAARVMVPSRTRYSCEKACGSGEQRLADAARRSFDCEDEGARSRLRPAELLLTGAHPL